MSSKKTYKETYAAIEKKISEIKKIQDPGERYLKFAELNDNVSAAYDHDSVDKNITWSGGEYSELTMIGAVMFGVGAVIGPGAYLHNRMKASGATKHANKMWGLHRKVYKEMTSLAGKDRIESLLASPRAAEIAEKFPSLKEEFDHHASVIEAREKLNASVEAAREKLVAKDVPAAPQKTGPKV